MHGSSPKKFRLLARMPREGASRITQRSRVAGVFDGAIEKRHKPTVHGNHVGRASSLGRFEQCGYVLKRGSERLFDNARDAEFQELDAQLRDLLDRDHRNATVESLSRKHFVNVAIGGDKS